MQDTFFGPDAGSKDPTKAVEEFWDWLYKDPTALPGTSESAKITNAMILEQLHGKEYVANLYTIMKGMRMDIRRFRVNAQPTLLQGDVVKTSRTLMGPLNVWQRRVSASNWIRLGMQAKRAMDVMSDPNKIRHLTAAKGYPVRSRPGMAALIRSGILPGITWEGQGELPQDLYEQGLAYLSWLQDVGEYDAS